MESNEIDVSNLECLLYIANPLVRIVMIPKSNSRLSNQVQLEYYIFATYLHEHNVQSKNTGVHKHTTTNMLLNKIIALQVSTNLDF